MDNSVIPHEEQVDFDLSKFLHRQTQDFIVGCVLHEGEGCSFNSEVYQPCWF